MTTRRSTEFLFYVQAENGFPRLKDRGYFKSLAIISGIINVFNVNVIFIGGEIGVPILFARMALGSHHANFALKMNREMETTWLPII